TADPDLHSFPTRRSSDLGAWRERAVSRVETGLVEVDGGTEGHRIQGADGLVFVAQDAEPQPALRDGPAAPVAVESLGSAEENARSEEHTSELQSRSDLVC